MVIGDPPTCTRSVASTVWPLFLAGKVRPDVEPSLVSKVAGAKFPAIKYELVRPSEHLLNAVKVASCQELFTRVATPVDETLTKRGSLELKPSSADRGENEATALAKPVPSLKVTETDPAEVAPVTPDNVALL